MEVDNFNDLKKDLKAGIYKLHPQNENFLKTGLHKMKR